QAQPYSWQDKQRQQARRSAGNEPGAKRPIADYYTYPLNERTTIAENQTKQVGFLEANGVSARKAYEYRAEWFQTQSEPVHADTVVEFANSSKGGLGAQLPAGVVRVYVRDVDGKPKFVGENQI